MRPRRSDVALLAAAVVILAGGAWVWQAQGDSSSDGLADPPTPGLMVSASGTAGDAVSGTDQFSEDGDTAVRVAVSRLSGGKVSLVDGPSPSLPTAVRFPSYRATGPYPRAVLSLTPTSGSSLTPGTGSFSYGAVLRLDDAVTSGRPEDNGDNVFQRGLSSEQDLFKLEMDHDRPACTVRGSTGTVIVRANGRITRGAWYAVTCRRVGDKVTVTTEPYGAADAASAATVPPRTVSGSIGAVTFAAGRPASVGGKLLPGGGILRTASDQFNGAIAEVWVRPS